MRAVFALTRLVAPACLGVLAVGCDSEPPIRISRDAAVESRTGLKTISALTCPQTESVLTRRGAPAADGRSCEYAGPRGSLVTLRLAPVEDDASALLETLETEVQAELPDTVQRVGGPEAGAARGDAHGDRVDVQLPGVTVSTQGEATVVRIPGLSIDTDGERANVRIGGLSIRADDRNEQVDIRTDGEAVRIRAQDEAAEIRTRDLSNGVRATYILVDERDSEAGWRLVGYEARGPDAGPLAVALVRSRDRNEREIFDAARALVRLNVGD